MPKKDFRDSLDSTSKPKNGKQRRRFAGSGATASLLIKSSSKNKKRCYRSQHKPTPGEKPGKYAKAKALVPPGYEMDRKRLRKLVRDLKKQKQKAYRATEPIPSLKRVLRDEFRKAEAWRQRNREREHERQEMARKRREEEELKKQELKERKEAWETEREEESRKAELEESLANDENEIQNLEKLLKLNKRKSGSLPKSYAEEGLTYILDAIDPAKLDSVKAEDTVTEEDAWRQDDSNDSNDEEDMEDYLRVRKKANKKLSNELEEGDEESDGELEEDGLDGLLGSEMSEEDAISADEEEMSENEEEMSGDEEEMSGDEDEMSGDEDEMSGDEEPAKPQLKEDIYGRLRDADGNVVTQAYVPPAKRKEMETTSEAQQERLDRLSKQLKGQINRLSASNMVSISAAVEAAYSTNSRADVTLTLYRLISNLTLTDTRTPERLSQETSMLVALLHSKIGSEIGAKFIEDLAQEYSHLRSSDSVNPQSKKLDNILVFFGYLYLYNVIDALLITDIFHELTESFQDKDVELLLVLLRAVGFTLRKDDPAKLKDIIVAIQTKANAADMDQFQEKSRVKFMLEILLAIKNNNVRKMPNYDDKHIEHLKKTLKGLLKLTRVSADSRLRIGLADLLQARSKGKWWVVGSAWEGQVGQPAALSATQSSVSQKLSFSKKLLDLAKLNKMNSEIRRNIFCTIMSSEDYMDAFEKLNRLGLQGNQERDIIVVSIECCCNEKIYNAFYTYLLQKFIIDNHKYKFMFNTCLWDKFKTLGTMPTQGVNNLAAMTSQLINSNVCSLTILKNLEFAEIKKPMVKYLKTLLNELMANMDKNRINELFYKVGLTKMKSLREGLELFIQHFIRRKLDAVELEKVDSKLQAAINGLNRQRMAVSTMI